MHVHNAQTTGQVNRLTAPHRFTGAWVHETAPRKRDVRRRPKANGYGVVELTP